MQHMAGKLVVGPVSSDASPATPSIVVCRSLDDLDAANLRNVLAVCPEQVGRDCHIEVICKIKGIPVASPTALRQEGQLWRLELPEQEPWVLDVDATGQTTPAFQVSIFDSYDASRIDGRSVGSAFIRMEHVLTALVSKLDPAISVSEQLERVARPYLEEVIDALPDGVDLVVRGLDVRTGDVLARLMRTTREENPDLGEHGVRRLIADTRLAQAERSMVRALGPQVRYALPFVTRSEDLDQYFALNPLAEAEPAPILFLESPAAIAEVTAFSGFDLAIGLKDIAQFFFAADRSNARVAHAIEYRNPELVRAVCDAVRTAARMGSSVSLYQDRDSSAAYERGLRGVRWTRSVPASVHRELVLPQ
ncbi:putative PEP-binding protein [Neomicrococcus lactis]|uniref:putative PEP-binding protein n=1 Tax=Neomicrococcus lactis TaxID=732241 RepID=UPI00230083EE|nr:putative PEP-binding protein [Neomicrococcus lactis]